MSDPLGRITLHSLGSPADVYRMGLGITDFHLCGSCGVLVAATWSPTDDKLLGVVNLRALDRAADFTTPLVAVDFDGESVAERQDRRRLNWTPVTILATTEQ